MLLFGLDSGHTGLVLLSEVSLTVRHNANFGRCGFEFEVPERACGKCCRNFKFTALVGFGPRNGGDTRWLSSESSHRGELA
jgi:hypothetical protein